jgi:hypothetical protein
MFTVLPEPEFVNLLFPPIVSAPVVKTPPVVAVTL